MDYTYIDVLFSCRYRSSVDGPYEFRHYFEQIKSYGNSVNISRATIPFVVRQRMKHHVHVKKHM
jgi:hypothetical protein